MIFTAPLLSTFLSILYSVGAFACILSIIVFAHEFGHYIVAKYAGVKIETFSIGFGRELIGYTDRSGTRWKLALLPFGGYVKMFGDMNAASAPDTQMLTSLSETEKKLAFHTKPLLIKACIVAAGPFANFIFAFLILWGIFSIHGKAYTLPIISAVVPESAAARAGLMPQDTIVSIDGTSVDSFTDIQRTVSLNTGTPLSLTIKRGDHTQVISITPVLTEQKDAFGNNIKAPILGIQSTTLSYQTLSIGEAARESIIEIYHIACSTLKAIGQMITGKRHASDITGPIGIAKYSGQAAHQGLGTVLWFMVIISINLGLVNLFPIPILDGGHLLYYVIEAIQGKPLANRYQEWGLRFGMLLVAMLVIFAIVNDTIRLF